MQEVLRDNNKRVLRFDIGEDAAELLLGYCKENRIQAGWLNMIGAVKQVEIWYFNLDTKEYEKKVLEENVEVAGFMGNVGVLEDDQPVLHIHGLVSNQNLDVQGGHIKSMIVSATLEVFLDVMQGQIIRKLDETTGLYLMT